MTRASTIPSPPIPDAPDASGALLAAWPRERPLAMLASHGGGPFARFSFAAAERPTARPAANAAPRAVVSAMRALVRSACSVPCWLVSSRPNCAHGGAATPMPRAR